MISRAPSSNPQIWTSARGPYRKSDCSVAPAPWPKRCGSSPPLHPGPNCGSLLQFARRAGLGMGCSPNVGKERFEISVFDHTCIAMVHRLFDGRRTAQRSPGNSPDSVDKQHCLLAVRPAERLRRAAWRDTICRIWRELSLSNSRNYVKAILTLDQSVTHQDRPGAYIFPAFDIEPSFPTRGVAEAKHH